ncbi:MAG: BrnA antitoxin family protein [Candidatus Kapabacteria bacterium]|nr:BrnA antitoxin family protein [Candidatus Kapabacteria bacterium]
MKNIPKFESESEEQDFWAKNDSTEFLDWSKAIKVHFAELKPTAKSISLRLPESMIVHLKQEANKMDIPYQSLMKLLINEGLERRKKLKMST